MQKKLRLIGKIAFGLLLCHLCVAAPAQEHLNTFARNEPSDSRQQGSAYQLLDVLKDLEEKFGVIFDYNRKALKNKTVPIRREELQGKSLEEVLNTLLLPMDLNFERYSNRSYLIYSPKEKAKAGQVRPGATSTQPGSIQETISPDGNKAGVESPTAVSSSLEMQISGRVVSADNGEGLPGVNVLLKGTNTGTTTNADGQYNLSIPGDNGTLVFSYIGFLTQEVPLNGRTTIDVKLVSDVKALSEVVVVGYGTQQRRDLTGAIASVSEKQIKAVPVTGLDQALQGRAAGVQVTQNSGAPGGGVSVRIRGIGTATGNNEPLYVVDGVPLTSSGEGLSRAANGRGQRGNPLNTINPSDIESIEVLKDASATAIYGARGANGVVLITTKRGKAGTSAINFETYYGIQQVPNRIDLLTASEYAALNNEVRTNAGLTPYAQYSDPASLGKGTDWQEEIFRPAPIQNYQLSVSGGTEKTQYALSGGYFQQDGIIIGSDFNRYSLRLNLDNQASRRFKIGNSVLISRTQENLVPTESGDGMVSWALRQIPAIAVYNPDGTFAGPVGLGAGISANPVAEALTTINVNTKTRFLGSVYGEYQFIEGLTFRTTFGLDLLYANQKRFVPQSQRGDIRTQSVGERFAANELIWLNENTLTYRKAFGKHDLTALAGVTAQASTFEILSGSRDQFISNLITELDGASTANQRASSSSREWALLSYLARASYSFAGKYLFTGTVRADGSSRFGPNNRFGVFPSASVGWRISEESFMQNITPISDLKLRASYGVTGNQEIGLYTYSTYVGFGQNYNFGGQVAPGVAPSNIPNRDVRWESTAQFDVGLDLGLWSNRVTLTADYYVKNTNGMLVQRPISRLAGSLSAPTVNVGEVSNRGIELAISSQNLTGPFTWSSDLNFSANRNKLVSLGGSVPIFGRDNLTRSVEGQPIGQFFGWITDGIFQRPEDITNSPAQPKAAPGDIKFKNLPNEDGIYDETIDNVDRTFIGNPQPDFIYGLTNNFSYKGIELSIFLQGVQGNELYNYIRRDLEAMAFDGNQTRNTLNRWRQPGDNTSMPRAIGGDPNENIRPSNRYVEDGSFLRVRNITLGYTLPEKVVQALRIQRARIYVTAQNAFTFTRYSGLDPEVGSFDQNSLSTGIDYGTYPVPRTFLMGLNLSF